VIRAALALILLALLAGCATNIAKPFDNTSFLLALTDAPK